MFGVKIQGRLGNQLFQYAYAKVLSKKLNAPFFFLGFKHFYVHKYFDIKVDSPLQNRLKAFEFYLKNLLKRKEIAEDQFAHPDSNIANERDEVIYNGFYQSELYHHTNTKESLKNTLKIKPAYQISIADFVGNNKPNIVVHVRRTDYVTFGGPHLGGINLTLPLDYYLQALALLPIADCNILFLSDDISFVKNNLQFPNAIYAEGNSEIVDFQMLMQADYLVLANSSFSWWGAYLNTRAKEVISSKYWLGIKLNSEFPKGINCAGWKKI